MSDTTEDLPTSIRRVESDHATKLVRLVESYEDMQTVLACCERLIAIFGDKKVNSEDIGVEAIWTLALLSYARCFSGEGDAAALSEDDLADEKGEGGPRHWHRVLLHLRDHQSDVASNPREVYSVGVAQDEQGTVNAVAVTSIHAPMVDEAAVRQAGAIALPLCGILDGRISDAQKAILEQVQALSAAELDKLELIEVAPAT